MYGSNGHYGSPSNDENVCEATPWRDPTFMTDVLCRDMPWHVLNGIFILEYDKIEIENFYSSNFS
jgi:hypothetical protein